MGIVRFSYSQTQDTTKQDGHFSGRISVTNNGISLIPSLTLGKPAAIFEFSIGGEKLVFEPQFRFAMEGKPWSFIFWWRYHVLNNEKFKFKIGAHPAFSFKTRDLSASGGSEDGTVVRRFLAGELAPTFSIAKNIKISPYYLYAYGFEAEVPTNTHYIALQGSISNIQLTEQIYAGISPQLFYLKMDNIDGFYVASGFSLAKRNFPFSASAMINKTIKSEISGDDFLWNVSIIYSFNKKYM